MTEIVIVDDDPLILTAFQVALAEAYTVHCFTDPGPAETLLSQRKMALAILDLNFPELNGLDLLQRWKRRYPDLEILTCSGETNVARAIACLRQGASDYVVKPFLREDLLLILQRTLEKSELKRKWDRLKPLVLPRPVEFIGTSLVMQEVLDKVKLLAHQVHLNVLILGESGTGKEVIARLLHQQESDAQRPFVIVNMPAIPATLMESELFGVEKGAFTDAKVARAGKFEQADGGDIFLDEIGDLPLETQSKILRALQEKQIERIGSQRSSRVQFRVISATNRPLADLMSGGEFREDLIYRLSDMVLWIPPLRERKEDIPVLIQHFIKKYSRTGEQSLPAISERALQTLIDYHWPGNVRQLESTIKRALVFNRGAHLDDVEIYDPTMFNPARVREPSSSLPLDQQLEQFERRLIQDALRRHGGNRDAVMQELQLSRATFYRRILRLEIHLD